jgi:hypothetical protein
MLILKLIIPGRLPSWNKILSMGHWQRAKLKKWQQTEFISALSLSEKWTLDCLRYIGVIRGDEPDKITLETTQRKAAKGEAEHTLITITYPL